VADSRVDLAATTPTEEPPFQRLEKLGALERSRILPAAVLLQHPQVVAERCVRLLQRVLELEALEDEVVRTRLLGRPKLRIDGSADPPNSARLALDPDHDALEHTCVVHPFECAFGKSGGGRSAPHRDKDTIAALALSDFFRNPFSFLFARSRNEERLVAYVIREHQRGRSLTEILDDPYVRNRTSEQERARLLDNPELIRAIGKGLAEAARSQVS
jgi:hypothetical protein